MRKNAKERKRAVIDDEIKVSSFFKIIIAILIILVIFTLITLLATRDKKDNVTANIEFQYDKILVGSILNRVEDDYFVLVQMKGEPNSSSYKNLIDTYSKKSEHSRFYYVDLGDEFNSKYVGSENNIDFTNILDVKFANTTLLHIKDGKIVSQRSGDDIMSYLEKISA